MLDRISPPSGPSLVSGLGDIDGFRHNDLATVPSTMFTSPVFTSTTSLDYAELSPNVLVRPGRHASRASTTRESNFRDTRVQLSRHASPAFATHEFPSVWLMFGLLGMRAGLGTSRTGWCPGDGDRAGSGDARGCGRPGPSAGTPLPTAGPAAAVARSVRLAGQGSHEVAPATCSVLTGRLTCSYRHAAPAAPPPKAAAPHAAVNIPPQSELAVGALAREGITTGDEHRHTPVHRLT